MALTSPLLEELTSRGCPVEKMLSETYMDNERLYERLLKKLPNNNTFSLLEDVMAKPQLNVTEVFEASHNLKGMYATLGLQPLFVIASDICETARAGSVDGAAEKFSRLKPLHAEFLGIIQKYI